MCVEQTYFGKQNDDRCLTHWALVTVSTSTIPLFWFWPVSAFKSDTGACSLAEATAGGFLSLDVSVDLSA